jgi:hypothetical protein
MGVGVTWQKASKLLDVAERACAYGIPGEVVDGMDVLARLFSEDTARILIEVAPDRVADVEAHFEGLPFAMVGRASGAHDDLVVNAGGDEVLRESISELKAIWKNGLTQFY